VVAGQLVADRVLPGAGSGLTADPAGQATTKIKTKIVPNGSW
jgi:hypothetical protein